MTAVRLPLSSTRTDRGWAKLLRWVRFPPQSGFDFDGEMFVPGRLLTLAELQPEGYPVKPVILECAGIVKPGRGHNRSEYLYLVWQYDKGRWFELGRCRSSCSDWAANLGPIALEAIRDQAPDPDLNRIAGTIREFLGAQLEKIRDPDRNRVLGLIHDELAASLIETGEGWAGRRIQPAAPSSIHTH